jgi:hypothetical protein
LNFAGAAVLTLTATDAVKAEGDFGSTSFTFTVTRSGITSSVATANWAVSGGTANATDFGGTLPSGTMSFAAGDIEETITVQVRGDTAVEPDETFNLFLSSQSANVTLATAGATGTIHNDDLPPAATLSIEPLAAERSEGNSGATPFTFTVTRSDDTSIAASANWAVAGSDLLGIVTPADATDFFGGGQPTGSVNFAAGETEQTVTVQVQCDTAFEPNEGFEITLSEPSARVAIDPALDSARGIINADDAPRAEISIEAVDAVKAEGTGFGLTEFTFKVTRTGNTSFTSTATWTASGTAVDGTDLIQTGTVVLLNGQTERMFTMAVIQDSEVETDENFTVTLSNPGDGTDIGTATASGTILNDDLGPAVLSVAAVDADMAEGDSGTTNFTFSVMRSGETTVAATADWAARGPDVDGFDLVAGARPSGQVSFAAGETEQTIIVEVKGDSDVEGDEPVQLELSNPSAGAELVVRHRQLVPARWVGEPHGRRRKLLAGG